jgi:heptosyltransferase-1
MKGLIVKTSSMGDIIHTLPALSDVHRIFPELRFDWLVENAFSEIPLWHTGVDKVIPVSWRKWRKNPFKMLVCLEFQNFYRQLREVKYDFIIDTQGLLKSALLATLAKGPRYGLDRKSAREQLASLFYQHQLTVEFQQHAVHRMRLILSKALNYSFQENDLDFGIQHHFQQKNKSNNIVFIHGTSNVKKEWPMHYWQQLCQKLTSTGYGVLLPWGSLQEKERAECIAANCAQAKVLNKSTLTKLAQILVDAKASVAVDTGLGHLSAAFSVPTVSLYGPTDPEQIGTRGQNQLHLVADQSDLTLITPEMVFEHLMKVMELAKTS